MTVVTRHAGTSGSAGHSVCRLFASSAAIDTCVAPRLGDADAGCLARGDVHEEIAVATMPTREPNANALS